MQTVGKKLICTCHGQLRYIAKHHPRLGLLCQQGADGLKEEIKNRVDAHLPGLTRGMVQTTIKADIIQKYKDKSTPSLKKIAIRVFNAWIRKRDAGKPCISCGRYVTLQAGHFYSAGNFNHMRFNEDNVHGQCLQDNYYKQQSDTLYRKNLIEKIGAERVAKLDFLASVKTPQKDNRFFYIELIEKYKSLNKLAA